MRRCGCSERLIAQALMALRCVPPVSEGVIACLSTLPRVQSALRPVEFECAHRF